jgi:hypothetical protein
MIIRNIDMPEKKYLANFVEYYEQRIDELLAWGKLNDDNNKVALLRIISAMESIPKKQVLQFLNNLDLQK